MCHNILKAAKTQRINVTALLPFLKLKILKYKKNFITLEFKNTFFILSMLTVDIDVDCQRPPVAKCRLQFSTGLRQRLLFCRLTAGSPFHHALHRNAQ